MTCFQAQTRAQISWMNFGAIPIKSLITNFISNKYGLSLTSSRFLPFAVSFLHQTNASADRDGNGQKFCQLLPGYLAISSGSGRAMRARVSKWINAKDCIAAPQSLSEWWILPCAKSSSFLSVNVSLLGPCLFIACFELYFNHGVAHAFWQSGRRRYVSVVTVNIRLSWWSKKLLPLFSHHSVRSDHSLEPPNANYRVSINESIIRVHQEDSIIMVECYGKGIKYSLLVANSIIFVSNKFYSTAMCGNRNLSDS